jgi:hypothetical protein
MNTDEKKATAIALLDRVTGRTSLDRACSNPKVPPVLQVGDYTFEVRHLSPDVVMQQRCYDKYAKELVEVLEIVFEDDPLASTIQIRNAVANAKGRALIGAIGRNQWDSNCVVEIHRHDWVDGVEPGGESEPPQVVYHNEFGETIITELVKLSRHLDEAV